ncbi:MAG: alpha/beta fold hydrolase [Janthinobacterium lividum]
MDTPSDDWADRAINLVRTGPQGGAPVILVHPVGLDLSYWDRQIEALRGTHDVVAFDLPGHGRTPGTPADWTLDHAAGCLGHVIQGLDAGPAHLVGLSVGGMISQALALAHPDQVRSLTLIDTAAAFAATDRIAMRDRADAARRDGMAAVLETTIKRWFTVETERDRPDLIDRVSKTLLADDPLVHAAMWDMIAGLDLVSDLHRIAVPTLILVGEFDPSSPPAAARVLQENIRAAEMHVIVGASHMAPIEKPDTVNAHLVRFLAGHGSASRHITSNL